MYEIACNARGDFIISINGTYAFLLRRGYARQVVRDLSFNSRTGAYARLKRQLGVSHTGCKVITAYIEERLQLPVREIANGPFVHVWSSPVKGKRLIGWELNLTQFRTDLSTEKISKYLKSRELLDGVN